MDITQSNQQFAFPINLDIEPIKRLLVIDIKKDNEFECIEPQLFDDKILGKGIRLLMYRKDKKVDVYRQPGVKFNSSAFKLGGGIGYTSQVLMEPAFFEISNKGVDLNIVFTDKLGRRVELIIKENSDINSRFPFLAPVGKNVDNPNRLFLVYMTEFDFVKREGTIINLKIGNKVLQPATFPIFRDKKKVYFSRYASRLVIGNINSADTKLLLANLNKGYNKLDELNVFLDENEKIKNCWIDYENNKVELAFNSGFPNLLTLPENLQVKGNWEYLVSGIDITGGYYLLHRIKNIVKVEFNVTRKWKPLNIPFSFKVFIYIMRSFRTWPTSYKWLGTVNLDNFNMQGRWYN